MAVEAAPAPVIDLVGRLELQLAQARRQLAAVEAVREEQAQAADFYSAVDDHVRAAVTLHCEAALREALAG